MVTRLDMKSDAQIGQIMRELGLGRLLGRRYFLISCLLCV